MKRIWVLIPLILFLLVASVEYFLLLRHKSPYLSDSYFYQHMVYSFQGSSFDEARKKTLQQLDNSKLDEIEKNFYWNENQYRESLSFFIKRPLYPAVAYLLTNITNNLYSSLLVPVYLAYIGSIALVYIISQKAGSKFVMLYTTVGLLVFYPFLDWSTYFLTDTIGAFFWLLQLLFIYYYFQTQELRWLYLFASFLALSLCNREQSALMIVFFFSLLILFKKYAPTKIGLFRLGKKGLFVTFIIVTFYLGILTLTQQKTLYDTLLYTQNNYGLYNRSYSLNETALYFQTAIKKAHLGLMQDLLRHRGWVIQLILATGGTSYIFLIKKKPKLLDNIMLASSIASYAAIFLYPVLSYRYFIPLIIGIVYFSGLFVNSYIQMPEGVRNNENKQ